MSAVDLSIVNRDRFEFNQTVQQFKQKHRINLKDLLKVDKPEFLALRKEFWSQHTVKTYLSRGSDLIQFVDDQPLFEVDRSNKNENDYYEFKIYQLAAQQSWIIFPFRELLLTGTFYQGGALCYIAPVEKETKRRVIGIELHKLLKVQNPLDILVTPGEDIYKLRTRLLGLQFLRDNQVKFVLSSCYTHGHAIALISIIEQEGNRLLTTISIDSQNTDHHFFRILRGFEARAREAWTISGPRALERYNEFKSYLGDKKVRIDMDQRVGYLLDKMFFWASSDPDCREATIAKDKEWIDVLHNIEYHAKEDPPEIEYRLFDRRPFTMIRASNKLQTADDDLNCALYTHNTLQAAIKLLEQPEKAKAVYQHALTVANGTPAEKDNAEKELVQIFREEIKTYLPCYFNSDGALKSEMEIKDYHLKQRWDLGSAAALDEDYLRHKYFLP